MKKVILIAAMLVGFATTASAQGTHRCAADARKKADALLKLHFDDGDSVKVSISDKVDILPSVRGLRGQRRLDVLEVWGYIYKAEYRMRFLYAQTKSDCALIGQEILEAAN